MTRKKTFSKIMVIALAILLAIALSVGISGAWYNAQRKAAGTITMNSKILIDYNGFSLDASETTWEKGVELNLFDALTYGSALPGSVIPISSAQIKKNANSIDFYARVKVSYKFSGQDLTNDAPAEDITGFDSSLLITTPTLFSNAWVSSNNNDGWFYYASGTTLSTFSSSFVDIFANGASFVIEGENFIGENNGEGGGFKINISGTDYAIRQIDATLTLETIQASNNAISSYPDWVINAAVNDLSYSLTLNLDGATLTSANVSTLWNDSNYADLENSSDTIILPTASEISKTDYTFAGWYDNSSFTGSPITSYTDENITGNVNLYAKWIQNTYTDAGVEYSYDAANNYYVLSDLTNADADVYYVLTEINGISVGAFGENCANSTIIEILILQFTSVDRTLADSLAYCGDIVLCVTEAEQIDLYTTYGYEITLYE